MWCCKWNCSSTTIIAGSLYVMLQTALLFIYNHYWLFVCNVANGIALQLQLMLADSMQCCKWYHSTTTIDAFWCCKWNCSSTTINDMQCCKWNRSSTTMDAMQCCKWNHSSTTINAAW
jgi:hypothetical protein